MLNTFQSLQSLLLLLLLDPESFEITGATGSGDFFRDLYGNLVCS